MTQQPEYRLVPLELIRFLLGEGDFRGRDFGDPPPTINGFRAPYWWRDHLRPCLSAAPQPEGDWEVVAAAGWNAARRASLVEGEDDCGPWPPVAGKFGWQEDDSEMTVAVERLKADAILSALGVGEGR